MTQDTLLAILLGAAIGILAIILHDAYGKHKCESKCDKKPSKFHCPHRKAKRKGRMVNYCGIWMPGYPYLIGDMVKIGDKYKIFDGHQFIDYRLFYEDEHGKTGNRSEDYYIEGSDADHRDR